MKARHRITFREGTGNSKQLPIDDYLPTEWKEDGIIKTRSVPNCLEKYMKIVNEAFKEMTIAQKAVVDQAIADQAAQAATDAKDFTKSLTKLDKAGYLTILDEINVLRDRLGEAERTIAQLKSAIASKYDTLPG